MTYLITIETDNAAFHAEDPDLTDTVRALEVGRILTQATQTLALQPELEYVRLRDVNGNTVGELRRT